MPNAAPSFDQLKNALVIAEQIQKLEAELTALLGGGSGGTTSAPVKATKPEKPATKKRVLSPEGKARIVAALRARWAKVKGEKPTEPANLATKASAKATPTKARRKISPEGRAKMAPAAKKRRAGKKAVK